MTQFESYSTAYYIVSALILVATVFYIARSPINAVRIGRDLNNKQQKDNTKSSLFLTLFSLRGNPLHYDFVTGLNQIDIVFEDSPSVLAAWHIHYDSLNTKNQVDAEKAWDLQRTNLLSSMAESLGYHKIRQTDMMQNYTPVGHNAEMKFQYEFREAEMNFYKSSTEMAYRIMDNMDAQVLASKEIDGEQQD